SFSFSSSPLPSPLQNNLLLFLTFLGGGAWRQKTFVRHDATGFALAELTIDFRQCSRICDQVRSLMCCLRRLYEQLRLQQHS
ncbi:hypothetical protein PMAYCL1PPCAC_21273, partial [Pristionchus mayeri]